MYLEVGVKRKIYKPININNKNDTMTKQKCKQCGYEWESRKEKPKTCPFCKRYDWKDESKREDQDDRK